MPQGERPYEYSDRIHLALNYEMYRNKIFIEREVYTSLDWFGNLGGLSEGLRLLFGLIIGVINYKYYNNYMVAKLFSYKPNNPFDAEDNRVRRNTKTRDSTVASKRKAFSKALSLAEEGSGGEIKLKYKKLHPCVLIFHSCIPKRW